MQERGRLAPLPVVPFMQTKNQKTIAQEFEIRQTRQIIAIAIALFCVLLCAVLYKKPILFEFSKSESSERR
jgi:hypothetical protein